jgi:hypothetical protein
LEKNSDIGHEEAPGAAVMLSGTARKWRAGTALFL